MVSRLANLEDTKHLATPLAKIQDAETFIPIASLSMMRSSKTNGVIF
ncbi:MAG: hypothetical protein ACFFCH_11630 [Promethearchaeota archaeon]